jgi:trk system potassium uptake protein TrkA
VGSAVASRLAGEGWTVSVIDQAMESFNRLDPTFPGERIEGHALDEDVLLLAGIERADACVVSTDGDNTNLVTAQIVLRKYGVATTVVRVLDPARAELYARLGLRTVCPTTTAIDTLSDAVLSAGIGV